MEYLSKIDRNNFELHYYPSVWQSLDQDPCFHPFCYSIQSSRLITDDLDQNFGSNFVALVLSFIQPWTVYID